MAQKANRGVEFPFWEPKARLANEADRNTAVAQPWWNLLATRNPAGDLWKRLISTGAASGAKLSRLGVCCGGSTPTPPRLQRASLAAGCACSGPRAYLELELVLEPG